MHFLLTAVYHTNQHYDGKGSIGRGTMKLSFLALVSEHSAVYDWHFNLLFWVKGDIAHGRLHMRAPSHCLVPSGCLMSQLAPDAVVCRNPIPIVPGLLSVIVARLMGRTVIFYTRLLCIEFWPVGTKLVLHPCEPVSGVMGCQGQVDYPCAALLNGDPQLSARYAMFTFVMELLRPLQRGRGGGSGTGQSMCSL